MSIANDFAREINRLGEDILFRVKGSLVETQRKALVQTPNVDTVVNDYEQTSFILYLEPLTPSPARYDGLFIRGKWRAVDSIVDERMGNVVLAQIVRVSG